MGTEFWGRGIALFRGSEDGMVRAIEDRCAHRQVKLSLGEVHGCELTCPYHGWTYGGDGRLVTIPHELFGRNVSKVKIASYPVKHPLRPDLDLSRRPGPRRHDPDARDPRDRGPYALGLGRTQDFTWDAHHSMIIENVSDFTHAHLHRKYRPFTGATLTGYARQQPTEVRLTYDVLVGDGRFLEIHGRPQEGERQQHGAVPANTHTSGPIPGGRIKHWCFFLPMNGGKHPRLLHLLLRRAAHPADPHRRSRPG